MAGIDISYGGWAPTSGYGATPKKPTSIPAGGTEAGPAPGPGEPGYLPPGSSSKTEPNPTNPYGGDITTYSRISPADAPSSLTGLTNAANLKLQQEAEAAATAARQQGADLTAQAEARRLHDVQNMLATMPNTTWNPAGGAGSPGSTVQFPTAAIRSAQDLAYARAKDRVAQNARASVNALASEMAARGVASTPGNPSGIQENATAGVLAAGGGQLADVIAQQAADEAAQQAKNYETAYAGGITQRGQDVSARGQDLAARTGMAQSILGLIRGSAY
jgi:hypothetical protein